MIRRVNERPVSGASPKARNDSNVRGFGQGVPIR